MTAREKIRVFIVDDHPFVRQGLALLINQQKDMTVCGEAEDENGALKQMEKCRPDIAFVDITLKGSNGINLIKSLKKWHPDVIILVLSMYDEALFAERVLRAGARGYIMKQDAPDQVLTAIRQVLAGDIFLSEKMSAQLLKKSVGAKTDGGGDPIEVLTDREIEVFQLIGEGKNTREAADLLHLSVKTVEVHRENIKKKLGMASAVDLAQFAARWVHDGYGTMRSTAPRK